MKGDCRLCNQLGVQPLLSAQALKMIAFAAVAQGASQCSQKAQRSMVCRALRASRLPPLYLDDVPLWCPVDAQCVCPRQCVPFLLIHELVLQLVSDDTVGDWLGWADGREEVATTWEDWKERVDMSSKLPPCAAFSLWGRHCSLSHCV